MGLNTGGTWARVRISERRMRALGPLAIALLAGIAACAGTPSPPPNRPAPSRLATEVGLCPDTAIDATDSLFIEAQVEKAVMPLALAYPPYPPEFLERRIRGFVLLQFVVNTAGCAEPGSLRVLQGTDSAFARVSRDAVRRSRFTAAERGGRKVRQVVQMPFTFYVDPRS